MAGELANCLTSRVLQQSCLSCGLSRLNVARHSVITFARWETVCFLLLFLPATCTLKPLPWPADVPLLLLPLPLHTSLLPAETMKVQGSALLALLLAVTLSPDPALQ